MDIAKLQVSVGADTREAEQGLKRVSGQVDSFGESMRAGLGVGASLAAVAGIGAVATGFGAAVSAASGFEKTMSAVKAVSGATADEMEQISAAALKIGKDTSFSAKEAASGMEELIKAGVSTKDAVGGAAAAVATLAEAGGVDLKAAAEIGSNAMNVFGKSGRDMAGVANTISGAVNASAIDMNDFKFSMASFGAVAATVGFTMEDTATAIAVMGQAGVKGSDAGTSLKTMMLNLQPATEKQKSLFSELGIVTAEGGNAFFDASGKIKSMAEVAGVLQGALGGMSEQQKIATLETMFGSDAIRAGAILTKAGAAGFDEMAASMGKVSAADVAAERLNNLSGSMEKLKGSVETGAVILGGMLTPALKGMADSATEGVNGVIAAIEALPGAWSALSAVFAGELDVPSDFIEALGLGDFVPQIWEITRQAGDAWRTFQQVFAGEWAPSGRIDPFVNAVGQAAVVLRDQLLPAAAGVAGFLTGTAAPAFGAAVEFLTKHAEIIAGVVAGYLAFQGITAVVGAIVAVQTAIAAASAAIAASGGVIATVVAILGGPLTIAVVAVAATIALLTAAWIGNWGDIQGKTVGAVAAIVATLAQIDTFSVAVVASLQAMGAGAMAAWDGLVATISGGVAAIGPTLDAAWAAVGAGAQTAWDAVAAVVTTAWTTVVAAVTTGAVAVQSTLEAAWAAITGAAQAAWDGVTALLAAAWATITMTVQAALAVLAGVMVAGYEAVFTEPTRASIATLTAMIGELWVALGQLFGVGLSALTTTTTTWWSEYLAREASNWELTKAGVSAAWTAVQELWNTALGVVTTIVTGWWDAYTAQEAARWAATQTAVSSAWAAIQGLWDAALAVVTNAVTVWWDARVADEMARWETIKGVVTAAWALIQETWNAALAAIGTAISEKWAEITGGTQAFMASTTTIITDALSPWAGLFFSTLESVRDTIQGAASWVGEAAMSLGSAIMDSLKGGINAKAQEIIGALTGAVKGALDTARGLLGGGAPGGAPAGGQRGMDTKAGRAQYAAEQARKRNLDPDLFVAQLLNESNLDPGAVGAEVPGQGRARGIGQFMPATAKNMAQRLGVTVEEFWGSVELQVQAAAMFMEDLTKQFGSQERALSGYFSGPGGGVWPEYVAAVRKKEEEAKQLLAQQAPSGGQGGSLEPLTTLGVDQTVWGKQLGWEAAKTICGPYAAAMFADTVGRMPTPEEAAELGRRFGWQPGAGMTKGDQVDDLANAMIQKVNPGSAMRVAETWGDKATIGRVAQQGVERGPVGFNTSDHYFMADQYNPETKQYRVGATGTTFSGRGGKEWMTLDEIQRVGAGLQAVLTIGGQAGDVLSGAGETSARAFDSANLAAGQMGTGVVEAGEAGNASLIAQAEATRQAEAAAVANANAVTVGAQAQVEANGAIVAATEGTTSAALVGAQAQAQASGALISAAQGSASAVMVGAAAQAQATGAIGASAFQTAEDVRAAGGTVVDFTQTADREARANIDRIARTAEEVRRMGGAVTDFTQTADKGALDRRVKYEDDPDPIKPRPTPSPAPTPPSPGPVPTKPAAPVPIAAGMDPAQVQAINAMLGEQAIKLGEVGVAWTGVAAATAAALAPMQEYVAAVQALLTLGTEQVVAGTEEGGNAESGGPTLGITATRVTEILTLASEAMVAGLDAILAVVMERLTFLNEMVAASLALVVSNIADTEGPARSAADSVGSAIVDGLKGPIESRAGEIAESAAKTVSSAIEAARSAAGAASPSREMQRLGHDMVSGLVIPFRNGRAERDAGDMMTRTIGSLYRAGLEGVDWGKGPIIRPLQDMLKGLMGEFNQSSDGFLRGMGKGLKPIAGDLIKGKLPDVLKEVERAAESAAGSAGKTGKKSKDKDKSKGKKGKGKGKDTGTSAGKAGPSPPEQKQLKPEDFLEVPRLALMAKILPIEMRLAGIARERVRLENEYLPTILEVERVKKKIEDIEYGSLHLQLQRNAIETKSLQLNLAQMDAEARIAEAMRERAAIVTRQLALAEQQARFDRDTLAFTWQIEDAQAAVEKATAGTLAQQLQIIENEGRLAAIAVRRIEAERRIEAALGNQVPLVTRQLDLQLQLAHAQAASLPLEQQLAATEREIETIMRGTLAQQLQAVEAETLRAHIEMQRLDVEREIGATLDDQTPLMTRQLDLQLQLARAQADFLATDQQIAATEQQIEAATRGTLTQQLRAVEVETLRAQIELQRLASTRDLEAQLGDQTESTTRQLQTTLEIARVEAGALPLRQEVARVEKEIARIRELSAEKQIAAIDAEVALAQLRKEEIGLEDQLTKVEAGSLKLAQREVNAIHDRLDAISKERDLLESENELAELNATITSAAARKQLVGLNQQARVQDDILDKMNEQQETLGVQSSIYDALRAVLERSLIAPIERHLRLLDDEATQIQANGTITTDALRRQLAALNLNKLEQDAIMALIDNQIAGVDAQTAIYDASRAVLENARIVPLERQLVLLDTEAAWIEANATIATNGLRRQLAVLGMNKAEQDAILTLIGNQIAGVEAQMGVYDASRAVLENALIAPLERQAALLQQQTEAIQQANAANAANAQAQLAQLQDLWSQNYAAQQESLARQDQAYQAQLGLLQSVEATMRNALVVPITEALARLDEQRQRMDLNAQIASRALTDQLTRLEDLRRSQNAHLDALEIQSRILEGQKRQYEAMEALVQNLGELLSALTTAIQNQQANTSSSTPSQNTSDTYGGKIGGEDQYYEKNGALLQVGTNNRIANRDEVTNRGSIWYWKDPNRRARGGPVLAGTPYLVGEEGEELVVPRRDGFVLPHEQTERLLAAAAASGGAAPVEQITNNVHIDYHYAGQARHGFGSDAQVLREAIQIAMRNR